MKNIFFILTLLTINLTVTFGQSVNDTISMQKGFGGYRFYQGERLLIMKQLVNIMKPDEQAYKEIKAAQSTNTLATILGGAAGFMIGWPIGTALGGGEPNWTMAAVGAGLIVVSIPIIQKFNKQAKQAVQTWNSGLQTGSFRDRSEMRFLIVETGIGLSLRF